MKKNSRDYGRYAPNNCKRRLAALYWQALAEPREVSRTRVEERKQPCLSTKHNENLRFRAFGPPFSADFHYVLLINKLFAS